jgi:hypothetical protein
MEMLASSGVVSCTANSLAPGAAPDITIVVNAPGTPGSITNTAAVTTNAFDPATPNNSASASTLVGVAATATPTNTPTFTPTQTPTSVATSTPTRTPTTVPPTATQTPTPITGVVVPTLTPPLLALLGFALAAVALLFLRRSA